MDQLKDMIKTGDASGAWLRLLDLFRKNNNYLELTVLCRQADRLEREAGLPEGLTPLRVALLSGATTDMLVSPLRLALIATGFAPEIQTGIFNQFVPEMLDPSSEVSTFGPQVAVVVNTPFNIPQWPTLHDSMDTVERMVDQASAFLLDPCKAMHARVGCDIILNTLHPPATRPAGNLGAKLPGDSTNFVRRLNTALGDQAPEYVHLNDVASMGESSGLVHLFDQRYWYHAKQPFAFPAIGDYVRNTAAIVGAIFGKTKKCVVVDLDHTLWGGVIGDDGVEGIELGEGTAEGEAFKAFQVYLRDLKARGILLAVSSKNEEAVAKSAFAKHPEMVLALDDFVAFKANWGPKSDSLQAIAQELNLGLDAFVFLDDNPAEREQVRQALPEVTVPELPEEPADYVQAVESGRFFETVTFTTEDQERTQTYKARQSATQALEEATDLTSFLSSLDMKAVIRPFEEVSVERITQLTNKTNQFNLTTRRVTLSEIKTMAGDPGYVTRSVRLSDRFGDHGLISVFFASITQKVMTIEAWLMSCRVLKRNVEQALFNEVLDEARKLGVEEIIGLYKPTDRNGMVANHYQDLGFVQSGDVEGVVAWRLVVQDATPFEIAIDVDHGAS